MKRIYWFTPVLLLGLLFAFVSTALAETTYTVKSGDTLYSIAHTYGTTVQAIVDANHLENARLIRVGQVLIIPDGSSDSATPAPANTPAPNNTPAPAAPTSVPAPTTAPASTSLLPNPSFEGDWYKSNGINELQIPVGWFVATDEGANTLVPGDGGLFNRPECRVITDSSLPGNEADLFVFDGYKTIKCFKGGAPTSFSIFTDVYLQPGTYRFTMNFFPDIVQGLDNGNKVWATDPLAAEARVIYKNGGTNWATTTIGTKNTVTYTFTLTSAGSVRLGGSFRNRFVNSNNGWFLDAWTLVKTK